MIKVSRRPNLLLVENDRSIQRTFEIILDGCNWEVVSKENGDAAIKEWKTGDFAGILLDLDLPFVSGFEITRLIRRFEQSRGLEPIPILAITKALTDTDRRRCFQAGMSGFITKPIRPDQLCMSVGRYLCQ